MTPPVQVRERLAQISEDLSSLRQRAAELREARDIARRGDDSNALTAAEVRLDEIQHRIDTARALQSTLLHQVAGVGDFSRVETFLDDPGAIAQLEQLAHSQMPIGNLALGPAVGRDQLVTLMQSGGWRPGARAADGDVDLPDAARRGRYYGTVPQLRRRLRLLDLIPVAPMDGKSFDYTRELGSFDTAREVAEGAAKAQADVGLDEATVVAQTIAHWIKLKRPQLADAPSLDALVRTRLIYGVMHRLEDQVLAGDGEGENLQGILNTTGIGEVEFDVDVALADLALDGIVTTLLSDAEPDAVVVNPLDWSRMLKARTDDGTGRRLDSDGAFATPPDRLWGLPAIASKVMPSGSALVGDYATGVTVFVREGVNVRASDSDQDDFTRNRLTLLGEGRFGLAVWQPTAFTLVRFSEG